MTRDRRKWAFVAIVAVCVAAAVVSVVVGSGSDAATDLKDGKGAATRVPATGAVVFRTLDRSHPNSYGRIAWASAADPGRPTLGAPACERVYFAAGRGLCLSKTGALGSSVRIRILGDDLKPRRELKVNGVPSRARISPDGRYGTVTSFVTGHSYADPGKFSTKSTIFEMATGKKVADVEDFHVTKDGENFRSIDFNFWGVTFAKDDRTFYATLGTGAPRPPLRPRPVRSGLPHETAAGRRSRGPGQGGGLRLPGRGRRLRLLRQRHLVPRSARGRPGLRRRAQAAQRHLGPGRPAAHPHRSSPRPDLARCQASR